MKGSQSVAENLFWFSDDQWAKIEPHLTRNQRGPARGDPKDIERDHARLRIGCRWQDCPLEATVPARLSTTASRGGESKEFGKRYLNRRLLPAIRRNKPLWIAVMLKSIAAPAAEKGGADLSGDRPYQRRQKQQDTCDSRQNGFGLVLSY